MIHHKNKFIFVEIPKTGTTTICSALNSNYDFATWRHRTFMQYRNEYPIKAKEYFKFSFVRNPWDKLVSQFHFNRGKFGMENYSFKDYIRAFHAGHVVSIRSQSYLPWLVDENGIIAVDFIGRFENLQNDFDHLCDQIGIENKKLPHKNSTKHEHYTKYYDKESRRLVAEKYAKDIEYFGYEFGE